MAKEELARGEGVGARRGSWREERDWREERELARGEGVGARRGSWRRRRGTDLEGEEGLLRKFTDGLSLNDRMTLGLIYRNNFSIFFFFFLQ